MLGSKDTRKIQDVYLITTYSVHTFFYISSDTTTIYILNFRDKKTELKISRKLNCRQDDAKQIKGRDCRYPFDVKQYYYCVSNRYFLQL